MKHIIYLAVFFFCYTTAFSQDELTIMTFNIRYNNPADSINAWPYRKDKVISQVLFQKTDVLGVQEALAQQVLDIKNALTGYSYTGVGRDNGKDSGEYSAIFYNNERLTFIQGSTLWLSQSPLMAGRKGWDAVCARIITWAAFKDNRSGNRFFVFNTHFDHVGQIARRESARLLLHVVDSIAGNNQAIITGDFNAHPQDEPIQIITDTQNRLHLTDTRDISITPHYGPTGTFNAFGSKEVSDEPIDYIFFNKGITVLKHATISESWQGRFASDHFSVVAVIEL